MKDWPLVVTLMVVIILGTGVNIWCIVTADDGIIQHLNELTTTRENTLDQHLGVTLRLLEQCFDAAPEFLPFYSERTTLLNSGTQMINLSGEWRNIDNSTRSLTRINISGTKGTWTIQAWARCTPGECDWGKVPLKLLGDSILDDSPRYGLARWDWGFKETVMTLRTNGKELVLEKFDCFQDDWSWANYHSVEWFSR